MDTKIKTNVESETGHAPSQASENNAASKPEEHQAQGTKNIPPASAMEVIVTVPAPTPLLDKILSRFKMLRRSPSKGSSASSPAPGSPGSCRHQHPSLADDGPQQQTSTSEAITSTTTGAVSIPSTGCVFSDPSENDARKFRIQDLGPLCEQLDHLLDYINSTSELNYLIYKYPSKLQNKLDAQARELHSIYLEARAAMMRIQQVKNQRKAVRKEWKARAKSLAAIRDEEIKEMENYIALYDKTLMTRWEKIRGSEQQDVVESFIQDLKGKQKALEFLHTLAINKLGQLETNTSQLNTTDEKRPVSLALRRFSAASGGARGSAGRWRNKHYERVIKAPSYNRSQDSNTMTLVPLATAPSSLTLTSTRPGIARTGSSSTVSSASAFGSASSSFISTRTPTVLSAPQANNDTNPATQEHQSAFQALFSDIQHFGTQDNLPIEAVMPHLVAAPARVSGQAQNQNNNYSGMSLDTNDIELHTVHPP